MNPSMPRCCWSYMEQGIFSIWQPMYHNAHASGLQRRRTDTTTYEVPSVTCCTPASGPPQLTHSQHTHRCPGPSGLHKWTDLSISLFLSQTHTQTLGETHKIQLKRTVCGTCWPFILSPRKHLSVGRTCAVLAVMRLHQQFWCKFALCALHSP